MPCHAMPWQGDAANGERAIGREQREKKIILSPQIQSRSGLNGLSLFSLIQQNGGGSVERSSVKALVSY